ncbi:MAG: 4-hydroxybenzoate octaprenyltransferase [Hyphomicrobiaceae bacterium]|nr:4-hydroxybenzoate octaprenyltransferase [Hyphomicrobiaceae bacterium]
MAAHQRLVKGAEAVTADISEKPGRPDREQVADAAPGNWVDHWAPRAIRPYLRLARADRPIGVWLLLWPCWWSQSLATLSNGHAYPSPWLLLLFAVGAFVMRGAGCAYNDIVDREFDAKVARTASRPIPSGQISVPAAKIFMVALSLVGFLVLIQLNWFSVWLGIGSLALIALYPFMKRITYFPQIVLGLTFNWGALMGWAAVEGKLAVAPLLLYAGSVLWTIGYDTIYAHQDKEDDIALGLKSTAIRFGEASPYWVGGLYGAAWLLFVGAGLAVGAHLVFFAALALVALHFAWQAATLDIEDADGCLVRFRSNRNVGWIVWIGLLVDIGLSTIAGF